MGAWEGVANALTEIDGLQEADLVDVKLVMSEGSLAVLFDLRTALVSPLGALQQLVHGHHGLHGQCAQKSLFETV
jgi:hypothetical protein